MTVERHGIGKLYELDNLDDRREVFYLLTLLTIQEQKKFLEHAVLVINQGVVHSHNPPHQLLEVTQECQTTNETYLDLMGAIALYDLPVQALLDDLVKYVSHLGKLTATYRQQALTVPLSVLVDR